MSDSSKTELKPASVKITLAGFLRFWGELEWIISAFNGWDCGYYADLVTEVYLHRFILP